MDYEISKEEESVIKSMFLTDIKIRSNLSRFQKFKESISLSELNEFINLIINTSDKNDLNLDKKAINSKLVSFLATTSDLGTIDVENVLYLINSLDCRATKFFGLLRK